MKKNIRTSFSFMLTCFFLFFTLARTSAHRSYYSLPPADSIISLTTNLYDIPDNVLSLADGNVVVFDSSYSNSVDGDDALKLSNFGENFGIIRDGQMLSIEARHPVTSTDTIFYDMWNMKQQDYQLEIIPQNLDTPILSAYLQDTYLNINTPLLLNATNFVTFTVTAVAGSSAANRFRVIFINSSSPLPLVFTNVAADLQTAHTIQVNWNVAGEVNIAQYIVERSADGSNFTTDATIAPKMNNGQTVFYNWVDTNPANVINYYRIKSIDKSGAVLYSAIVKSTVENEKAISVYPNPLVGTQLYITLQNQPTGLYQLKLLNTSGQLVYTTSLNHVIGNNETIKLSNKLPSGTYMLKLVSTQGKMYTTDILVE